MRHTLIRLVCLLFMLVLAADADAQEVTIIRETALYERPSLEADTRAMLPAGLKLTLNARQDAWLAVSTSEGLIGWIPRSAAHVDEAGTPLREPENGAPSEMASVAAPGSSAASDAPVYETTGGLYNRRRWSRLSIGSFGDTQFADLSSAMLRGQRLETGLSVTGMLFDQDPSEPWYSLRVGGHLHVFALQPRGGRPIGLYVGPLLGWTQYYLGKNVTASVHTLHLGGEGGGYLHLGRGRVLLIPHAALRIERASYLGKDRPPFHVTVVDIAQEGTFSTLLLGVDVSFGGFVPGVLLLMQNGERAASLRMTFAF